MRSLKVMATTVALLFVMLFGLSMSSAAPKEKEAGPETIVLSSSNCVVFRGVVTEEKVGAVELELQAMSRKLNKNAVIYLVMDTPGGDVDAGTKFIDFVHGLPQKVKTITIFAASMGFHIVQSLDERLIRPSSTLMSHRAKTSGLAGEIPGELITRVMATLKYLTHMDEIAAERMHLSLHDYQELIRDEYWTDGRSSIDENAADRIVNISCDKSLDGTTEEVVGNFLGIPVIGVMAKCPAISGILGMKLGANAKGDKKKEAIAYATMWKKNKNQFVKDYILTGRYKQKAL